MLLNRFARLACMLTLLSHTVYSEVNTDDHNSLKYVAIFAHGLGGDASQKCFYHDLIGCPIFGENGPEWNKDLYGHKAGPQQSCLAQRADIDIVTKQLNEHVKEDIILLGISKGAATMLNTVGWLAENNSVTLKNIKAVILDSPFASPEEVAANIIGETSKSFFGNTIGGSMKSSASSLSFAMKYGIKKNFPNYDQQGITPLKSVQNLWKNVDKNMVIVFIHSSKDSLISIDDSRHLYKELKKHGFKNLYLIEACDGAHGNVCWGPDKASIFEKLCLIYVKHNLPLPHLLPSQRITSLQNFHTKQNQYLLSTIQPSIEEIDNKLHSWRSSFC